MILTPLPHRPQTSSSTSPLKGTSSHPRQVLLPPTAISHFFHNVSPDHLKNWAFVELKATFDIGGGIFTTSKVEILGSLDP